MVLHLSCLMQLLQKQKKNWKNPVNNQIRSVKYEIKGTSLSSKNLYSAGKEVEKVNPEMGLEMVLPVTLMELLL